MKPLLIDIATIKGEKIYDFTRREIFSPEKGNSAFLKFCTVSGEKGARSKVHTHPGDEIVVSLQGATSNFLGSEIILLEAGEGLCLSGQLEHATEVHTREGWHGLSLYCDDCPLLKKYTLQQKNSAAVKQPVNQSLLQADNGCRITEIFSPQQKQSNFLSLYTVSFQQQSIVEKICNRGETIYYCMDGSLQLEVAGRMFSVTCGTAALIPAKTPHTICSVVSTKTMLLTGSCSGCLLIDETPYQSECLC